jgi:tellurite methyltransferase
VQESHLSLKILQIVGRHAVRIAIPHRNVRILAGLDRTESGTASAAPHHPAPASTSSIFVIAGSLKLIAYLLKMTVSIDQSETRNRKIRVVILTHSTSAVPYDRLMLSLQEQFGQIDIYLFDQLLRGRIPPGARILDAGCGPGRNLIYLLRAGHEVYGVDLDPRAIDSVRRLASNLPANNFRAEPIERMSFPDAFADVVLSSAVLHFANDPNHFEQMLKSTWRVLKPGGLLFCRLASSIGIEHQIKPISNRRFTFPDGSERYLVDEDLLIDLTNSLGGQMLDPLKTTVVQNQRSMTTWIVRKNQ